MDGRTDGWIDSSIPKRLDICRAFSGGPCVPALATSVRVAEVVLMVAGGLLGSALVPPHLVANYPRLVFVGYPLVI